MGVEHNIEFLEQRRYKCSASVPLAPYGKKVAQASRLKSNRDYLAGPFSGRTICGMSSGGRGCAEPVCVKMLEHCISGSPQVRPPERINRERD